MTARGRRWSTRLPGAAFGVGNVNKGDDGAGPALILALDGKVPAICINAGVVPENYLEKIVSERPDVVLLVDAVDLGTEAGEVRLVAAEEIGGGGLSTHATSLAMACEYLKARIAVRIFLLGMQPAHVEFDTGLSETMEEAVKNLAVMMVEARAHA